LRAIAAWAAADFDSAARDAQEAAAEAERADDAMTQGYVYGWAATFGAVRRDVPLTGLNARCLLKLVADTGLRTWAPAAEQFERWSRSISGDRPFSAGEVRTARPALKDVGHDKIITPAIGVLAAEAEVRNGRADEAFALVEELITEIHASGFRWQEAELLRVRGEARLIGPCADPDRAGRDLETAVAVAREQGAQTFELRAALALAKLYQSTGRAADAHAVLAAALEGFSPTPEFPEIAEAQTLLAALAETDEVKNAAAARQRRLKLQVSLAHALLQARGQHSTETKAAFSHARELVGIEDPLERFSTYYGLWVGAYVRGEMSLMREIAERLISEAAKRPDSSEARIAHRIDGVTRWVQGDYIGARDRLEKTIVFPDLDNDRELAARFGQDNGVAVRLYLASILWAMGDCDRARVLKEEAVKLAPQVGHAPTVAYAEFHAAWYEMTRLDPARAKPHAEKSIAYAHEHGMSFWLLLNPVFLGWAVAAADGSEAARKALLRAIAACQEQGVGWTGLLLGRAAFAAVLSASGEIEPALATIDAAISDIQQTKQLCYAAEAHRIRGEILWKRDPANTAPAEEAFLAAIAIAREQKARSFELRAALSLAKLYQSTGRAADADPMLAPALEGFSPTPEFPEIEEAQQLLGSLSS